MKSLLQWFGVLVCVVATGQALTVRTTIQKTNPFAVAANGTTVHLEAQTDWHLDDYASPLTTTYYLYNSGGIELGSVTLTIDGGMSASTGSVALVAHDKPNPVGHAYTLARWTMTLAAGTYEVRHTTRDFQQSSYAGGYASIVTSIPSINQVAPIPAPIGGITGLPASHPGETGGSTSLDWTANYCSSATVVYSYSGPAAARFTGWNTLPLSTTPSSVNSGSRSVTLPINASTTDLAKHTFTISGQNAGGTGMTAESGKALAVEVIVNKSQKKPQAVLTMNVVSPHYYDQITTQTLALGGGSGTGSYWVELVSQNPAGIATLSGNVLTATKTGEGTVVVRGHRYGDNEYNDATPIERTIQIAVSGTPPADPDPTGTLFTNTTELLSTGGSATVSWTHGGGPTSATLSGQGFTGPEEVLAAPVGSRVVTLPANPSDTTDATYTWTLSVVKAASHAGHTGGAHPSVTATRTVIVRKRTAEPQASLFVNGSSAATVQLAGSPATCTATVSWSATNVQDEAGTFTVSGHGLNSTGVLSGSQVVLFATAGTYTYQLNGAGLDGTPITRAATVTVLPPPDGALAFTVTPSRVSASGGPVSVTWSTDATVVSQEIGGPSLGSSPISFSTVSSSGNRTDGIQANPEATEKTYYYQFRGSRADGSTFVLNQSVTQGAASASYRLTAVSTPYYFNHPVSGTAQRTAHIYNGQFGETNNSSWGYASPTQVPVRLYWLSNYHTIERIDVSPANAVVSWAQYLDPSRPDYNPDAFVKAFRKTAGDQTLLTVNLNSSTPSVEVVVVLKQRTGTGRTLTVRYEAVDADLKAIETFPALTRTQTYSYDWVNPSAGSQTMNARYYAPVPDLFSTGPTPQLMMGPGGYYYEPINMRILDESGNNIYSSMANPGVYYDLDLIPDGGTKTLIYQYGKYVAVNYVQPSDARISFTGQSNWVGKKGDLQAVFKDRVYDMTDPDTGEPLLDNDGNAMQGVSIHASEFKFDAWLVDGMDTVVPQTNPAPFRIPNKPFVTVSMKYREPSKGDTLLAGVHWAPGKGASETWVPANFGAAISPAATLADESATDSYVVRRWTTANGSRTVTCTFPMRPGYTLSPDDILLTSAEGATFTNPSWNAGSNQYVFTVPSGIGAFNVTAQYRQPVQFTITDTKHTYDRTVKKATVTASIPGWQEGVHFLVKYDGGTAPAAVKRVGGPEGAVSDYTITIVPLDAKYGVGSITGSTQFRVDPRELFFTWSAPTCFSWDNQLHSIAASPVGLLPEDASTFGTHWNYDATSTISATNAGAYGARAVGLGNYSGVAACNWAITPSPVTFSFSPTQFIFNGSSQGPTVTASDPAATWILESGGTSTAVDAGAYSFRAVATGNYTGSSVCGWSISPMPLTFTITETVHTEDGSVKAVRVEARDTAAQQVSSLAYAVLYTPRAPCSDASHTAAGFYDVLVVASGNYSGSATAVMEIRSGAVTRVNSLVPVVNAIQVTDPQSPVHGRTFRRSWFENGAWNAYLGRPGVRFHLSATGAAPIESCELEGRWGADPWALLATSGIATPSLALEHDFSVRLGAVADDNPLIPLSFQQGSAKTGFWYFRARVKDMAGTWSAWSAEVAVQVVLPLVGVSETLQTLPPAGGMGEWFTASQPKVFTVPVWIP